MKFRRALLPLAAFVATLLASIAWTRLFPDQLPEQSRWVTAAAPSWWERYVASGDYWIAMSQALSIAFASIAIRRWRERRSLRAGGVALGGLTLGGVLAAGGCFLVGCCGSPMLAVWASLLGTSFIPATKPLLALGTVGVLGGAWWWMERRDRSAVTIGASCAPGCCEPVAREAER
jgi:hypothetical protein